MHCSRWLPQLPHWEKFLQDGTDRTEHRAGRRADPRIVYKPFAAIAAKSERGSGSIPGKRLEALGPLVERLIFHILGSSYGWMQEAMMQSIEKIQTPEHLTDLAYKSIKAKILHEDHDDNEYYLPSSTTLSCVEVMLLLGFG
jgi:hypothetical protein